MEQIEPKCRFCKSYIGVRCHNDKSPMNVNTVAVRHALMNADNSCDLFELDPNKTVQITSKDIKVTGTPQTYGDGATRCSKEGKGRFDLIPSEVFEPLVNAWYDPIGHHQYEVDVSPLCIFGNMVKGEWQAAIIKLTQFEYGKPFKESFWPMLKDLAVHFQKGAEIYGERNCQRGIPQWSFKDSAMRHATQYFMGLDDEPHLISAIWNLWMYGWSEITGVGTLSCIKTDSEGIDEL